MIPAFLQDELKREVFRSFDQVKEHWDASLRPRLHDYLMECAGVELRASLGEAVDTDRLALRVWGANLTVEQQTMASTAAKDAALRTVGLALSLLLRMTPI